MRIIDDLSEVELSALEQLRKEVFPSHSTEAVARKLLRDALIGAGVLQLGSANRSRWAGGRARR